MSMFWDCCCVGCGDGDDDDIVSSFIWPVNYNKKNDM